MKNKLQTLLKHKLQWLMLLAVLLGVSQGVWGDSNVTVYFAPSTDWNGKTVKVNVKRGNNDWQQVTMTKQTYSYYGRPVYSGTFTERYGGLDELQFQKYNGSSQEATITIFNSWTTKSEFSGKLWNSINATGSWTDLLKDRIKGSWDGWSFHELNNNTYSTTLTNGTTYEFGIQAGNEFYKKNVTFYRNTSKQTFNTSDNNAKVTADATGTYVFNWDSDKGVSIDFPASCAKPDAVAISGTSTLTFANNSETVQTTLTATGTGDTNHDIYTYGWTNQTVMTGTAPSYSSTSAYNPTITFSREGTYTVRASAKCSGGTATTKDQTVTINPGRLYISGPLYNGTWAITDYMTRSVSGSTITYTKEWSANLSASGETNHFTVSRITTQNHASTIVNAYAYLATKTGISENGGTNNNLYPSFDVTEGDGLRLTVVYKGEVYGSGSSRQPKYYYTLEKTCSAVSKSQYTMATQSKQWTGSTITPTITRADGAGTIKNYYYSTNGSTWTSGLPTALGTYYIKIDVNAGSTYCAKDGIILDNQLTITPASRTISINNTDVVCGAGTYTLLSTASPDDSGTKTYSIKSDPSSIASIDGSTLALTGAGTFTVQVNITASGNYAAASGTKEFTVTLPTVGTTSAGSITLTGATLTGSVSSVTCAPTASGFEYKKGSDSYTKAAAASTTGTITKTLSNLLPGTTYTYRTYTTVNGVDKYGEAKTFTTTACTAPVISGSSLDAQSKCKDEAGTAMTVTASGGVGTLTYTWYKKNDTTPSGGTQVQSSTSNNYTPPTGTVGTLYYYCVVSSASPCASSTVNSGISGAVEIKAKPTLTISPAGAIYNYMPLTVSSDMDVATWSWSATGNFVSGYFTSELTRSATFKGKVVDNTATSTATFTATGTNGCNGTVVQDITKDTESCN